jgi:hypothetical protein
MDSILKVAFLLMELVWLPRGRIKAAFWNMQFVLYIYRGNMERVENIQETCHNQMYDTEIFDTAGETKTRNFQVGYPE